LLNWAARYYPIIRILKSDGLFDTGALLEIGAGPYGIGEFRKLPFVGCDLGFAVKPRWPMLPLIASGTQLPFKDKQFDVVVASDVLEHVPDQLREGVILECLRVSRKLTVFGFPCGEVAWKADQELVSAYESAKLATPRWLSEHMEGAPFPEAELFDGIKGWNVESCGNENIRFHLWLMKREMSRSFVLLTSAVVRMLPSLTESLLRKVDQEPCYRQIFALRRRADV